MFLVTLLCFLLWVIGYLLELKIFNPWSFLSFHNFMTFFSKTLQLFFIILSIVLILFLYSIHIKVQNCFCYVFCKFGVFLIFCFCYLIIPNIFIILSKIRSLFIVLKSNWVENHHCFLVILSSIRGHFIIQLHFLEKKTNQLFFTIFIVILFILKLIIINYLYNFYYLSWYFLSLIHMLSSWYCSMLVF